MRRARHCSIAPSLIGLLLVSSGCYGPYQSPYGQYGNPYGSPYGYPGGAPVQTLQPGGTYAPGPYGSPVLPQGTLGTPSNIDQTGGSAPFYNGGSTTQPYDGGGVPTYSDPNEVQFNGGDFQQPIQPDHTAVDEFGAVDGVSAEITGVARVDLENAHFVTPVMSEPTPTLAQPTFASMPAAPFAYDADYNWLRGVLRFDAASGTWTMIYSDNPAADDEHGGRILVADSPELESYKPQSVVLLRGSVDDVRSQAIGRAVYRIDAIEPVELSVP